MQDILRYITLFSENHFVKLITIFLCVKLKIHQRFQYNLKALLILLLFVTLKHIELHVCKTASFVKYRRTSTIFPIATL